MLEKNFFRLAIALDYNAKAIAVAYLIAFSKMAIAYQYNKYISLNEIFDK